MRNIFCVTLILCLFVTTANAQQVGKPAGNNPLNNFFDTSNSGGQLAHRQAGNFGNVSGSGNSWIGIGKPNIGPPAYGMRIQDGTRFCALDIQSGQSEIFWGGGSNNYLNFNYAANGTSSPTQYMSIRNNGKVIIGDLNNVGTTSSAAALTVVETNTSGGTGIEIEATTNRNPNLLFSINGAGAANIRVNDAGGDRLEFQTRPVSSYVTAMTILQNRNVGIGTTNPSVKLQVIGDVSANNYLTNSDKRFKKDIKNIENPMDLLNSINGVNYNFQTEKFPEKEFTEGKTIGFIAQDFEKDLPELIRKDNDGYYSVNYLGVVPILVEAVKEDRAIIDEQKALIEKQKDEMSELAERLAILEDIVLRSAGGGKVKNTETPEKIESAKVELDQNIPNPAKQTTRISYRLPTSISQATLVVFDNTGKKIQQFDLSNQRGEVDVQVNNLSNGIYVYSVVANGEVLNSKKFIVQK